MKEIHVIVSKNPLETPNASSINEVKGTEFQFFLQGFSTQAQSEENLLTSFVEVAPEMLDEELVEESEKVTDSTGEVKEESGSEEAELIDNKLPVVDESIETIEQKAFDLFFTPTPLRQLEQTELTIEEKPFIEGEQQASAPKVDLLNIQEGATTLSQTSELPRGEIPTDVLTKAEKVFVEAPLPTVESGPAIQQKATSANVFQTSNEMKSIPSESQAVDVSVEVPMNLSGKELLQPMSPAVEKAVVQVAEKLSQPLVQKVTAMNQGDTQKLTVELLPERLGKVEVTIKMTDNKIHLEFIVQNSQTRQLLENVKPKLEQIMHKQDFQEVVQGKVIEAAPVASNDLNQSNLSDQSNFQQGFQQERRQQKFNQPINKGKTFSEMALEKQTVVEKGSIDILA